MTERTQRAQLSDPDDGKTGELTLHGRSVSRGVTVGTALCLYGAKRQFYRREIASEDLEREIERFTSAVRAAKEQLSEIASADGGEGNQARIFETHILFLEDLSLLRQIETMIHDQRVNAEWAVKTVIEKYVSRYKSLSDRHLQEKYIDLEDVGERILTALGGGGENSYSLDSDTVIIAKELNPSTLIELSRKHPAAVVTESGGWTSHTFILARELELPAVTGIRQLLRSVETGEKIVVDGYGGKVILRPAEETLGRFDSSRKEAEVEAEGIDPDATLETLDGFEITLRANLDITRDFTAAARSGARGIGLYRSEFLFNQFRGYPSEDEQYESYLRIAEEANSHGIRIRTFDLSINRVAVGIDGSEKNPALGLRGIRLSKRYEAEFRTQIRALLRAAADHPISIVLPMISDCEEVKWAKRLVAEEKARLDSDGIGHGDPQIGVMIEVPAAVLSIDRILEEADFVNIGTNDLVQYLLAVDRDNEEVADWFRTVHSSVLKSLRIVLDAARSKGKGALVCGEMAGSPLYVPILLGLGAREFSMNINSLTRVRSLVSKIAVEECEEALKEIEKLPDGDERDDGIRRIFQEKWGGLVDFDSLLSFRRR
ncbi:MAG: phosphoenolpyruvate--protein phosphotransferase [Acidobacteriota bacterium]|nr:MAG: phosphoenolpyruvate--protein phosphotransferase [Acidobacteriota bacterium]